MNIFTATWDLKHWERDEHYLKHDFVVSLAPMAVILPGLVVKVLDAISKILWIET